jgi:hypothetical protein
MVAEATALGRAGIPDDIGRVPGFGILGGRAGYPRMKNIDSANSAKTTIPNYPILLILSTTYEWRLACYGNLVA